MLGRVDEKPQYGGRKLRATHTAIFRQSPLVGRPKLFEGPVTAGDPDVTFTRADIEEAHAVFFG